MSYYIVTTEARGVFFGKLVSREGFESCVLQEIQVAIYWDRTTKGFLGLSSHGPTDECRVSRPAPEGELVKITGYFRCSQEAVDRWKAQPWSEK